MAKTLAYDLGMNPLPKELGRLGVPEVMEPQPSMPGASHQRGEGPCEPVGRPVGAIRAREPQTLYVLAPADPTPLSALFLSPPL